MLQDIESVVYIIGLAAVAIIAVLNPFGNLPQFIAMTNGLQTHKRQKLFRNILWIALIIVLIFLLSGPFIMQYLFRVSLDNVRVAGGLILITMSMKNLLFSSANADYSKYSDLDFDELLKQSVIPMAFPMLVGPGTLAAVIVIAKESNLACAMGGVIVAFLFMFILFHFAATIEKIVGNLVLYVLSRIALVFIIAMGINMIYIGISGMLL